MMIRLFKTAAVVAALAQSASVASAAQTLVTQGVCGSDPCITFSTSGDIPPARTITVQAPFAGVAFVSFHGTMHCDSQGAKVDNFAEFETQIIGGSDTTPGGKEAGGLQLLSTLSSAGDHNSFGSITYNLASQRTFSVTEGKTLILSFRIARVRMGANVKCTVGKSAAFTVQFAR